MNISALSVTKLGVLLSALAVLISIFACTDIPEIRDNSFIPGPDAGAGEPEIKVLLEEAPTLKVAVEGPFKILGHNDADIVHTGRNGLKETIISAEERAVRLDAIGETVPGSIDLVLSGSKSRISINGSNYYGTVRIIAGETGLSAVNIIPIEHYLCGVVRGELGAVQPVEAFKAQAVAARTYALYEYKSRSGRDYHLRRTTVSQVFMSRDRYPRAIIQAVNATRGVVITYQNKLFKAYYSSTCGGSTSNIEDFWDCFPQAPFTSVPCNYCMGSTYATWEYKISKADLRRKLLDNKYRVGAVNRVLIPENGRGTSGRARFVRIEVDRKSHGGLIVLAGRKLRRFLGEENLRSTWFDIRDEGSTVVFSGKGFGHGVGMCQVGAIGRAEAGATYQEILTHYYTGMKLKKIY